MIGVLRSEEFFFTLFHQFLTHNTCFSIEEARADVNRRGLAFCFFCDLSFADGGRAVEAGALLCRGGPEMQHRHRRRGDRPKVPFVRDRFGDKLPGGVVADFKKRIGFQKQGFSLGDRFAVEGERQGRRPVETRVHDMQVVVVPVPRRRDIKIRRRVASDPFGSHIF